MIATVTVEQPWRIWLDKPCVWNAKEDFNTDFLIPIFFLYQKLIANIRNYMIWEINFWHQKINFWYQKIITIFYIRNSCIFWYQKFDFLISFADIRNHFPITEIPTFWYKKMISDIGKSNFWYQKMIFWYQKNQHLSPIWRSIHVYPLSTNSNVIITTPKQSR